MHQSNPFLSFFDAGLFSWLCLPESMASDNGDLVEGVPSFELFVPGRLCILGEHTDWAAQYRSSNFTIPYGCTLVCATNHGLYARVKPLSGSKLVYLHLKDDVTKSFTWNLDVEGLESSAKEGSFFSYVAGTASVVLQHEKYLKRLADHVLLIGKGLEICNYRTTLPMKKGLSSSAAVCVLVASAFDKVFGLGFTQEELMEIAFQGEMRTPSRCGRMDQCVVMGPAAVGLMTFDGAGCSLRKLTLGSDRANSTAPEGDCSTTSSGLYFVVVDLKAGKDTVTILRELNQCFPHPQNDTQALAHDYVRAVESIAADAVTAIERGDALALAAQMTRAQRAFDAGCMSNCPSQLTAPRLHTLMADPVLRECALAVKGVGSQGDGSAQILCDSAERQEQVLAHIRGTYGMDGFFLNIL